MDTPEPAPTIDRKRLAGIGGVLASLLAAALAAYQSHGASGKAEGASDAAKLEAAEARGREKKVFEFLQQNVEKLETRVEKLRDELSGLRVTLAERTGAGSVGDGDADGVIDTTDEAPPSYEQVVQEAGPR